MSMTFVISTTLNFLGIFQPFLLPMSLPPMRCAEGPSSRVSQPNCSLCTGLGHGCLSPARATQQGQPQAPAHEAEARCGQESYKEAVTLPVLSVQQQQ